MDKVAGSPTNRGCWLSWRQPLLGSRAFPKRRTQFRYRLWTRHIHLSHSKWSPPTPSITSSKRQATKSASRGRTPGRRLASTTRRPGLAGGLPFISPCLPTLLMPRARWGENRGSAAILLTDTAAQLCGAFFDRPSYPAARCTFRPAFTIAKRGGAERIATISTRPGRDGLRLSVS